MKLGETSSKANSSKDFLLVKYFVDTSINHKVRTSSELENFAFNIIIKKRLILFDTL